MARIVDRLGDYRSRVRRALTEAFEESHPPEQIAASFAVGVFVTAMPTGGLGLGLFVVLAYYLSWVNKTAIFASAIVLNPLVKPVVYLASYQLGDFVFGSEPTTVVEHGLLDRVLTIVQVLVLGNVLIALALSAIGYAVVFHLCTEHRRSSEAAGEEISPYAALTSLFHRFR